METPLFSKIGGLSSGTQFRHYLVVALRRKAVIIVSLLSVVLSTVFYVLRIEDVYDSFSVLVIEEENPMITRVMQARGRDLSFYQGILNSRTFLEMALDSIGIDVFRATFPKATPKEARQYIKNSLSLRKTEYTSFLHLNARARSSGLAYIIAATATDLFRRRCREVESEESRRAVVEIEKQLVLIRKKLETAEYDYRTYKEGSGNILEGMTPELKTLQEAYANDLAQLGLREADLKAEKTQLARLEAIITPTGSGRSPEILKLRSRLKEIEKERMRLEALGIRLSNTSTIHREVKEIEKQLLQYKHSGRPSAVNTSTIRQWQELRKSVINGEAELALFKRRLESYQMAITNYKKKNPDLLSQSLELLRLKRSKEIYENIYGILLEKAEEQRILSASSSAGIKIVDVACMPENSIPKNETRYYVLGVLLGLVLGFGIAFFIEFNDTTIKSTDDIERHLNLPVMGTIPHITHNKKDDIKLRRKTSRRSKRFSTTQYPRNLLNFSGDESVTAESYRSLRTNLSFVSPDNPLKCLLVTSAGPIEGKSLTIANLALAYAQMGKKTLLVDTDLRRPVMHHLFEVKREPGFSDLFIAKPEYDQVIRPTQKENMFLMTAGMFTPNPAELIASQRMANHVAYFRENFDIVFFDTPPVVAVTDATLLGTKLDGVLMVIRSHRTAREIVQRARTILDNVGVKIVGTVLNDIDLSHRYSSYGYYKYYYKYYYHYYKSKA